MSATIASKADLAQFEEAIADLAADGWDQDDAGRFDWDDFLGRLERYLDIELPSNMTDPVIRRVQRIARQAAQESI